MTSSSVPIVLCGRDPAVGEPVAQSLKPDFDVIHFFQGYEEAAAGLPSVLAGKPPQKPSSNTFATHNYAIPPRAVVIGRAFEQAQVEELRKLCKGSNPVPVIWLPGNPTKKPHGNVAPADYPKEVARDVAAALKDWLATDPKEDDLKYF